MTRWLTTFALLLIVAVLGNAQCSASCYVFGFPSALEHNRACCTDHCSSVQHSKAAGSHTDCQHKHSTSQYAEWDDTELYKGSAVYLSDSGVVVPVADVPTRLAGLVAVCALSNRDRHGISPGNSSRYSFRVLRI